MGPTPHRKDPSKEKASALWRNHGFSEGSRMKNPENKAWTSCRRGTLSGCHAGQGRSSEQPDDARLPPSGQQRPPDATPVLKPCLGGSQGEA